ncbi:hypothetical protein KKG80_01090, partial [Patescibacteria group bacterium]|nr:hypothetical protein [Patescibacteria group bacterium]
FNTEFLLKNNKLFMINFKISPYGIRPIDEIAESQKTKEEKPKNNNFSKILKTEIEKTKEKPTDQHHYPLPGGKFDLKA